MGLSTDIFFIKALQSNTSLMERLPAKGVYNNIANPDFDMENVELPYIIVNNDGGVNEKQTKDEKYEGREDDVNISVRIVCRKRTELAQLEAEVRRTILNYFMEVDARIDAGAAEEGDELKPYDYTFSFSDISNDITKPAFIRMFYYECLTENEILTDDE